MTDFLRLACLRYDGDDGPDRWRRAAALLAEQPEITRASVHAAAAAADSDALAASLAGDPALATAEGGPFGWQPILYLAYARHDPAITADAVTRTARLLLDNGADPDAGFRRDGLPTPFTALTGAFGGGDGDQPAHPQAEALAGVLLAAGADPNDGQALYNRQFRADDSHLALLLEHGLGTGDGGPWRARAGDALPSPAELVAGQLWWAVTHDMAARVRLLAEHGIDTTAPFRFGERRPVYLRAWEGMTPAQVAAVCGCSTVLDHLVEHGATRPAAEGVAGLVAAALAGDRATVDRLRGYAGDARGDRPGLIVWASARRAWQAVPLLAELGFDVNARSRGDVPLEQEWQTALHEAASLDDLDGARVLIDLGADPNLRDARFDATPLGWAEHFGHDTMAEFLRPMTAA